MEWIGANWNGGFGNQIPVRESIDIERNNYAAFVSYRPSHRLTIKGDIEHENTVVRSLRDDLEWTAGPAPEADPDLKRSIDLAVGGLDENHRLVFVMHDMEGFTHQEIASAMDAPVGTIKARLSRARQKLRDALGGPELSMEME